EEGTPTVAVAINTSAEPAVAKLPFTRGRIVLCTSRAMEGLVASGSVELPPLGAVWAIETEG
ncbi:MAG: hypothetical protein C4321_00610, partial [Chloroflexota bacterium]